MAETTLPAPVIAKRFALWLLICGLSAAPSFGIAVTDRANVAGMVVGVMMFVLAYTLITSTTRFERLYRRPFVRATMYVGYGLRLLLSLSAGLFALTYSIRGPSPLGIGIAPDLFCGFASVTIANWLLGQSSPDFRNFGNTLLITCIQGAILNVIVFMVMGIAYGLQRAFRKWPGNDPRGFEVELVALPMEHGDRMDG